MAARRLALVPIRLPLPAWAWTLALRSRAIRSRPPALVASGMGAETTCSVVQRRRSPSPHLWGARLTAMWSARAIEAATWIHGRPWARTLVFLIFLACIHRSHLKPRPEALQGSARRGGSCFVRSMPPGGPRPPYT